MTTNIESKSEYFWQWESQEGRTKTWHLAGFEGNFPGNRTKAMIMAGNNSTATGNVRLVRIETQTYQEEAWNVPQGSGQGAVRTDLTEDEEAALKDPATIAAVNASEGDPGRRPRRPLS
jgi:hypothetical protein